MVHVVMGSTGEYSDRTEWPVRAFTTEQAANDFIGTLTSRVRSIPKEWTDERWDHADKIKAHMADFDPDFASDYTGTSYFRYDVPMDQPK